MVFPRPVLLELRGQQARQARLERLPPERKDQAALPVRRALMALRLQGRKALLAHRGPVVLTGHRLPALLARQARVVPLAQLEHPGLAALVV